MHYEVKCTGREQLRLCQYFLYLLCTVEEMSRYVLVWWDMLIIKHLADHWIKFANSKWLCMSKLHFLTSPFCTLQLSWTTIIYNLYWIEKVTWQRSLLTIVKSHSNTLRTWNRELKAMLSNCLLINRSTEHLFLYYNSVVLLFVTIYYIFCK